MAKLLQEEYKTYSNYEKGWRKVGSECRTKLFKMGLNLNWLDTGDEREPMTLPAKEVPPGTVGGQSWSQTPQDRKADAVRRALEGEPAAPRRAKIMPRDLALADQWLEDLILKGRTDYDPMARWEWIGKVAEEIASARDQGLGPEEVWKSVALRASILKGPKADESKP